MVFVGKVKCMSPTCQFCSVMKDEFAADQKRCILRVHGASRRRKRFEWGLRLPNKQDQSAGWRAVSLCLLSPAVKSAE